MRAFFRAIVNFLIGNGLLFCSGDEARVNSGGIKMDPYVLWRFQLLHMGPG